ncbi:hypothetical protein TNCV_2491381 [Trichonephila clavipes]|nr:hypothetical protein TNCV_2491381 [Trichonephila clavipes]
MRRRPCRHRGYLCVSGDWKRWIVKIILFSKGTNKDFVGHPLSPKQLVTEVVTQELKARWQHSIALMVDSIESLRHFQQITTRDSNGISACVNLIRPLK